MSSFMLFQDHGFNDCDKNSIIHCFKIRNKLRGWISFKAALVKTSNHWQSSQFFEELKEVSLPGRLFLSERFFKVYNNQL